MFVVSSSLLLLSNLVWENLTVQEKILEAVQLLFAWDSDKADETAVVSVVVDTTGKMEPPPPALELCVAAAKADNVPLVLTVANTVTMIVTIASSSSHLIT